jgi:phage protein D
MANGDTQSLAPEFRVRINGSELPPATAAMVQSVTVDQDVTVPAMFTVDLVDQDLTHPDATWADADLFAPGGEAEILLGYTGKLLSVMKGEITGLEPEFRSGEIPRLVVRGHDRRHRLQRGRGTRSFTQVKDSDVASQIAQAAGLTPQATDTGAVLDYLLQHNQTDLEFLEERARRLGYEVAIDGKTLYFRPHGNDGSAALTLARDLDLLEFQPRLTTLGQVGKVTVQGWSVKDKEAITGQAAAGDLGTTMGGSDSGPQAADQAFGAAAAAVVGRPVFSQDEADAMALGQLERTALSYVTGEGMVIGRPDLVAGTVIEITGFGRRFSGLYYVISARHSYTPARGYRTAFAVRRNAT